MKSTTLRHFTLTFLLCAPTLLARAQNPFDVTAEAWRCMERQQPDSAIMLQQKAVDIFKKEQGERHPQVGVALKSLAEMYSQAGQPQQAIRQCLQALDIEREAYGEEDNLYMELAANLARYYDEAHQYKKAIEWGERVYEFRKDAFPPRLRDIGSAQSNLTWYYADAGDYHRAISMCLQAVETWTEELGEADPYIALLMNNLAGYYASLGDYQQAVSYDQRSMDVVMLYRDTPDTLYAASLSNMADHYALGGYNAQCIEINHRALQLRRQLQGDSHVKTLKVLGSLASAYARIDDIDEALRLQQQIVATMEQTGQTDGLPYVRALSNLGILTGRQGNLDEAIRLTEKALAIERNRQGTDIHTLTSNLALFYGTQKDYKHAVDVSKDALRLIQKQHGKQSVYYARQLSDLSMWYNKLGKTDRAIRLSHEAIERYEQLYGTQTTWDLTPRNNLAQMYAGQNRFADALAVLSPAADKAAAAMLRNFTGMSAQQRSHYWNKYSGLLINLMPRYTLRSGLTEHTGQLYNQSALFAKSLLLNTELELARLIFESGDQKLVDDYYEVQAMKTELEKLRSLPRSQRQTDADSLQMEVNQREAALGQASKAYGDYCHSLTVEWEEVRDALKPGDLAVEFLYFREDTTYTYVALTLKPGYTQPRLTEICTQSDLVHLNVGSYYNNPREQNVRLCQTVWQPLAGELEGVERIYFAPAGQLYQIGIEQLPWDSISIAADHYQFYRLSSTRELCQTADHARQLRKAALYGGLAYDILLPDSLLKPADHSTSTAGTDTNESLSRGFVKKLNKHRFSYLKNTQVEVDDITATLGRNAVECTVFTNEEGTEQTLKQLGGQHYDLLHVATHGQYVPADQAEQMKQQMSLSFLQTASDNQQTFSEDMSLTHSLLAMSGANTLLNRISKMQDSDDGALAAGWAETGDGVLTAGEISRIDLRGMQLVVLSACQTGLGDVTQEGVMGLQRGFKKAGAQSILMSLWPVDDRATALLMQTFYRHLMQGETKRQAFLAAQTYLRQRYAKAKNAEMLWGAFILLDALD